MSFVGLAAECFSGPAQVGSVNARICNTTRRLQATNLVCGAPAASIPRIYPLHHRYRELGTMPSSWRDGSPFGWVVSTPSTSTIGALIVLYAYVRTWRCRPSFLIHRRFLLSNWRLPCTPAVRFNLQYPHWSSLQWLDGAVASRMVLWRHGLI